MSETLETKNVDQQADEELNEDELEEVSGGRANASLNLSLKTMEVKRKTKTGIKQAVVRSSSPSKKDEGLFNC